MKSESLKYLDGKMKRECDMECFWTGETWQSKGVEESPVSHSIPNQKRYHKHHPFPSLTIHL